MKEEAPEKAQPKQEPKSPEQPGKHRLDPSEGFPVPSLCARAITVPIPLAAAFPSERKNTQPPLETLH